MAMINLQKQQEEVARMRGELDRLNRLFAEEKKNLGLAPDAEIEIPASEMTPALQQALEAAKEEAAKAGRAAAASIASDVAPVAAPRRARRGAISA